MPFRSVVAEPQQLSKLAAAFDSAWMVVNNVDTVGEASQKQARQRLAAIILDLWCTDPDQALAARAIERFQALEPV